MALVSYVPNLTHDVERQAPKIGVPSSHRLLCQFSFDSTTSL